MENTKTVIVGAILGVVVTALLVRAPLAAFVATADTSRPELRAIAELNDRIQERFKDIDGKFGIRRIVKVDQTPHRFAPENVREMDAVRLLGQARVDAVLYLAGRQLLAPGVQSATNMYGWGAVKGPVQITKISGEAEPAPPASAIQDDAREALIAFAAKRSFEFGGPIAGWNMAARPIRASDAVCLKCHRERTARVFPGPESASMLRVGDPLGVVVYGYRSAK